MTLASYYDAGELEFFQTPAEVAASINYSLMNDDTLNQKIASSFLSQSTIATKDHIIKVSSDGGRVFFVTVGESQNKAQYETFFNELFNQLRAVQRERMLGKELFIQQNIASEKKWLTDLNSEIKRVGLTLAQYNVVIDKQNEQVANDKKVDLYFFVRNMALANVAQSQINYASLQEKANSIERDIKKQQSLLSSITPPKMGPLLQRNNSSVNWAVVILRSLILGLIIGCCLVLVCYFVRLNKVKPMFKEDK